MKYKLIFGNQTKILRRRLKIMGNYTFWNLQLWWIFCCNSKTYFRMWKVILLWFMHKKSLNLHVHKCYSSKPFTVINTNHGTRLENIDAVKTLKSLTLRNWEFDCNKWKICNSWFENNFFCKFLWKIHQPFQSQCPSLYSWTKRGRGVTLKHYFNCFEL